MFNKNSVIMAILTTALMAATGANAREASEGPRGADNPADVAEAGQRHGRGADDLPGDIRHGRGTDDLAGDVRHGRGTDDLAGHVRHGRGADDLPGTGGADDDGTPDQGPGDN
ncbi:MAG: hypothetical protein ABL860_08515 [Candidatus Nitrotoga sp.]